MAKTQKPRRAKRAPSRRRKAAKPKVFEDQDQSTRHVTLRLGDDLKLPADVAVRKLAFIGKSGSGKSHAVGLLLEQMRKNGIRFIVLDPVGTHTGVAQLEGVVFHEVQLGMHVGRFARHILENDLNIIVNLRALTFEEQRLFVRLFCENLYRWNKDFGPRHLVVEEVQQFAPQGGKAESKGILQVLSTMGRMEGIGMSVITQRPAIVDKTVIANTDCYAFFQLMLPQDLGAVKEVLTARASLPDDEEKRIERMIGEMPTLGKGEVNIYSPEWLQFVGRFKINGRRVTPHTGGTPDNYVRPMGDEPGLGGAAFQDGEATRNAASPADAASNGSGGGPAEVAAPGAPRGDSAGPGPDTGEHDSGPVEGRAPPRANVPASLPPLDPPRPRVNALKVAALVALGALAFPAVLLPIQRAWKHVRSRDASDGS